MTRPFRLLAVAVLAVVLASPLVQNAFAGTWLVYDNDPVLPSQSWDSPGNYVGVLFSLPSGWSGARVLTVRYYIAGTTPTIVYRYFIHIIASGGTDLFTVELHLGSLPVGWSDLNLTPQVVVTGDFYAAVEYTTDPGPSIGFDTVGPYHDRSYHGTPAHWTPYGQGTAFPRGDLMIRVEVDPYTPSSGPVGGVVEPVNKLTVLAPYLALFGLVAAVAVVVAKKREKTKKGK